MSSTMLKVLMVGLDSSGKTSIIYTLEQKLASFHALKPTVSFNVKEEFTILGVPVKIWDLGGQKQYRDEYLEKKGFIFGETNLIFFVVDVQDTNRYSQAVEYFTKAVDFLIKIGLTPIIMVLLHKVDPEIKGTKKIRDNLQIIRGHFSSIPASIKIDFFETSIYDRDNLSRSFIAGIFKALPKTEVIKSSLNDLMKNAAAEAVILLDENVLIVGEEYKDDTAKELCRICGPFFANMTEKLLKYNLTPPKVLEAQMEGGWIFQIPLLVENARFYLAFFTKERNLERINKFLPAFTKDLSSLIKYVV
jgi:small GTP-binding protein